VAGKAAQDAGPDLSMIPSGATKIACLDYNFVDPDPPLPFNRSDPKTLNPFHLQWGEYYGMCPLTTYFKADSDINNLRTSDSRYSAHYLVSGICNKEDPIIGTGGISRRAEISSHVQPTDAIEGDERWYYLAIRPALKDSANSPAPPNGNYFLVTQWHPKTNRSPALSINFHKPDDLYQSGSADIGEDHKLIMGPLNNGVWTDYVLHVKFSQYPIGQKKGTGWVEAWQNGHRTVCAGSLTVPPTPCSQTPGSPTDRDPAKAPAPFAA